jgi:hypothetical protein
MATVNRCKNVTTVRLARIRPQFALTRFAAQRFQCVISGLITAIALQVDAAASLLTKMEPQGPGGCVSSRQDHNGMMYARRNKSIVLLSLTKVSLPACL